MTRPSLRGGQALQSDQIGCHMGGEQAKVSEGYVCGTM